ncbi:hypothetical protein [Actinocatenispora rupis]|uniref:Interferon-induced transmembrane protein n=1 Tax=Actinocatenispora rupis TaxID=519421 RepID=A0A8J3J532_9ACTN|nr:hypothetical protein [Actinocatenispora rupis]GID14895.1 hypothetical protein Aru02nite_57840 [Actinocatenispora rupis]
MSRALDHAAFALGTVVGAAAASPVAYAFAVAQRAARDHAGAKAGVKAAWAARVRSVKKLAIAALGCAVVAGVIGIYTGTHIT